MQKWEYKTIKIEIEGLTGGILPISEFNETLNQLGKEGWELICAFGTNQFSGQSREAIAILKRPI